MMPVVQSLVSTLAAAVLTLASPGVVLACIPPLPMTAAEEDAQDMRVQAELWARHDMVFAVIVTGVASEGEAEAVAGSAVPRVPASGQDSIRVQLNPIVVVKGDQPLPAAYEIRDIFVGCAPRGLQRARVGQRYLIYGQPSSAFGRAGGIVEVDRLRDAETILAVYQAASLAALKP